MSKKPVLGWTSFVRDLMDGEYTRDDSVEVDVSFAIRGELESTTSQLSPPDKEDLELADALFRSRGVYHLERSGLLAWYRSAALRRPAAEWWWHL